MKKKEYKGPLAWIYYRNRGGECVCFCVSWSRSASAWIKNSKSQDWTFFSSTASDRYTQADTQSSPMADFSCLFYFFPQRESNRQPPNFPTSTSLFLLFNIFGLFFCFVFGGFFFQHKPPDNLHPLHPPRRFITIKSRYYFKL